MDAELAQVLLGGAGGAGTLLVGMWARGRWVLRHLPKQAPPAAPVQPSVQPCTDEPDWGTLAAALQFVPESVRADFLPAWTTGVRHGHRRSTHLVQWCTRAHAEEPADYVRPEDLRYTAPWHEARSAGQAAEEPATGARMEELEAHLLAQEQKKWEDRAQHQQRELEQLQDEQLAQDLAVNVKRLDAAIHTLFQETQQQYRARTRGRAVDPHAAHVLMAYHRWARGEDPSGWLAAAEGMATRHGAQKDATALASAMATSWDLRTRGHGRPQVWPAAPEPERGARRLWRHPEEKKLTLALDELEDQASPFRGFPTRSELR